MIDSSITIGDAPCESCPMFIASKAKNALRPKTILGLLDCHDVKSQRILNGPT